MLLLGSLAQSDSQVQAKSTGRRSAAKNAISPEFVPSDWERKVGKAVNLIDPSIRSSEGPAPKPDISHIPLPFLIDPNKSYAQSVKTAVRPAPLPITQKQEKFNLPKFLLPKPAVSEPGSSAQPAKTAQVPIVEGHSRSTKKNSADKPASSQSLSKSSKGPVINRNNPFYSNNRAQADLLKKVSIPKRPRDSDSSRKVAAEKRATAAHHPTISKSSFQPRDLGTSEGYKTSGKSDLEIHNQLTGNSRPTNLLSHPLTSRERLEDDRLANYPQRVRTLLQTVESQRALFLQNAKDPPCQLLSAKVAAEIQMYLDKEVPEEDFVRLFQGWNPLRLCCEQVKHPRMASWFERSSHPDDVPPEVQDRIQNMNNPNSQSPATATHQPMMEDEAPTPAAQPMEVDRASILPEAVQPQTIETPLLRNKPIEVDLPEQPLPQLAPQRTATQSQAETTPPITAPPPPEASPLPGAMPPPPIPLLTRPTPRTVAAPRANRRQNNCWGRQAYPKRSFGNNRPPSPPPLQHVNQQNSCRNRRRGYQASIHEEMIRIGRTMQGQFQTLDAMRRQNCKTGAC
ncbi:hypothetical protein PCANC_28777 [Puccinia coronata f. sp. avenae]|uniref:Uncharacterized protein n=1 Tax=Puccinia coronata f. sp. avenae TaxID=200324 RepID=A0A2N5TIC2_9BASI|nr:hypothetical protein PCANC_28777 [Puccinia coronata f. sp. avenae]